MVPHENVCIQKIYKKTLDFTEIYWSELLNYMKALEIPRKERIVICFWEERRKVFNFCRSKAIVEPKTDFWLGTTSGETDGGAAAPLAGHFEVFGPPVTTLLILLSDL